VPRSVACAVVRDEPPQVFVAEDQETLNWVLALRLISRIPGNELPEGLRDRLRAALRDEQWGEAVELWMQTRPEVDVYPSFEFYAPRDVELAAHELEFTPLFSD
jgi:hypothetical protein